MDVTRRWTLLVVALAAAVPAGAWAGVAEREAPEPRLGAYQLFWGDVHGHTELSDGKGTLDAYFTHARDIAGLDFAIVTDHDFGNGPPWHMPKEHWQKIQEKVDAYTIDGAFVAIAGYEWTSQPKYWTDVDKDIPSERLFPGPPRFYNHKNVYFPSRVDGIFSAKNPAYQTPDLLAQAVLEAGGLIHHCHPTDGLEGRDQWDYRSSYSSVIANTEIGPDIVQYGGKTYTTNTERIVREFLNASGKAGFVRGTDTHEGKPAACTAVLAKELSRSAIFDALRHRRNYAVSGARIVLDFRIDGHFMGEEIETAGVPTITLCVHGCAPIEEIAIVRDGLVLETLRPGTKDAQCTYRDASFGDKSYYYVRVTQADKDEQGNNCCAWSSPIWVRKKR